LAHVTYLSREFVIVEALRCMMVTLNGAMFLAN